MVPDRPPKVFISYAHDTSAHSRRVLDLANRLRTDGFDCDLDQFHSSPPEGWQKWMERGIADADFVLVVVTKRWYDRCMGKVPPDTGLGVRWESTNIYQHLYDAGSENTRFIPVLFDAADKHWIPKPLGGATHYLLDAQYADLIRRLDGIAPADKAHIGTRPKGAPPLTRSTLQQRPRDPKFYQPAVTNFPDHDIVRNNDFVGREDELARLHVQLSGGDVAITHALSGEGGVGKTQLAIAYAYRHQGDYDGLWWVDASNNAFEASLARLAVRLDPALPHSATPEDIRKLISGALSTGKHLLILDSLEDAAPMEGLHVADPSRILITTRLANLPTARVRDFAVEVLSRADSLRLLAQHRSDLRRALPALPPADGTVPTQQDVNEATQPLRAQLNAVAEYLGDHALSLTLCGKYLRDYPNVSPGELLGRLQAADVGDRDALLTELDPKELGTNYRLSVAQSLTLHLPKFRKTPAMKLLAAAAYCHPDDILIDLLADAAVLKHAEACKWLRKLADVSILDYTDKISLHRLTQQAVRSQRRAGGGDPILIALLLALAERFAAPEDYRNWAMQDAHDAHAATCIEHTLSLADPRGAASAAKRRHQVDTKEKAAMLAAGAILAGQVGNFRYRRARFVEAEPLMRRALVIDENTYGPDHANVARDVNNLAQLLQATNRLAEAEPLMRRALAICEKSYGPDHPNVAESLNNLAVLLHGTNRLAEAEPLMCRALAIDEKAYGPEHPAVATDLSNLAQSFKATNRLAEAEPLMRRALAIHEKSYGPEHPAVATDLSNLALLLQATNRLAEAEPLVRRALAIDEKAYGPYHPEVAIDLNNLAQLLHDTNRLAEAEALMRRALAIDEKSYGPDHPNVAIRVNNLAVLLQGTNHVAEAEPLMRRALAIDERAYGPGHPNVARDLNNLALLLQGTNRLAEAEPLMRRALTIDEKAYGIDHPKVATRLNNLALLLQGTNRLAEAEPLMRRCVEILRDFRRATGHPHPHMQAALENYESLLKAMNLPPAETAARMRDLIAPP
ncbi:MAG: tetratricopeptide repeat protein [Planctomycetes bacterium]|nr:tetratricopeptide repeat protein [Planctomycetota bacterium]